MSKTSDDYEVLIKQVVENNFRTLPNSNFEHDLMQNLHAENEFEDEFKSQLGKSFKYFYLSIICISALILFLVFGDAISTLEIKTIVALLFVLSFLYGAFNIKAYRAFVINYTVGEHGLQ